ncbi:MAG: hypothetical protein ACRDTU_06000 [Micromonosporaceae bacterium]
MLTHSSDFTVGPGGVMTPEVGVVTGELTLRTEVSDSGAVTLKIQYKGAEEWYAVAGGEITLPTAAATDPAAVEAIHRLVLGVLERGGAVPPGSEGWTPQTAT